MKPERVPRLAGHPAAPSSGRPVLPLTHLFAYSLAYSTARFLPLWTATFSMGTRLLVCSPPRHAVPAASFGVVQRLIANPDQFPEDLGAVSVLDRFALRHPAYA